MFHATLTQSAKAQRQRGGILAWLALCFVLVIGLVVVGGVFFVHSVRVHERNGNEVQVETPFGSVHVKHNTTDRPESAGIPLYPGARPTKHRENASVDLSGLFGDQGLHIVAGKWFTEDPIEKVQKYYQGQFPDMSVIQHENKVEMHSVEHKGKRVIVLCSMNGGTEIALASVGEPKAN
jgi:hypothetical protein